MNFRKTFSNFLHNVADTILPEEKPLLVPDFLTGEQTEITDPELKRKYKNLDRFVKSGIYDDLVIVMEDGQPTARFKNSVGYYTTPAGEQYKGIVTKVV